MADLCPPPRPTPPPLPPYLGWEVLGFVDFPRKLSGLLRQINPPSPRPPVIRTSLYPLPSQPCHSVHVS